MSPDSIETRVRQLEQAVAAIKARSDDHETDVRQYAPSLIQIARLEEQVAGLRSEIGVCNAGVTGLRSDWRRDVEHFEHQVSEVRRTLADDKLDREKIRAAREERERERERSDRRYRITTIIAAAGLILTAIGLAVAIITLGNPA